MMKKPNPIPAIERLAQAVASRPRRVGASWYSALPSEKRATVDEYIAAVPDVPGATYAMAWRTLTDDGIVTCRLAAFREHIRQVRHGSGN